MNVILFLVFMLYISGFIELLSMERDCYKDAKETVTTRLH